MTLTFLLKCEVRTILAVVSLKIAIDFHFGNRDVCPVCEVAIAIMVAYSFVQGKL